MADPSSLLVILSRNSTFFAQISAILEPFGWHCQRVDELSQVLVLLECNGASAFLVDDAAHDGAAAIAAVRGLAAPANGTPVFTSGPVETASKGAGGHLATPLASADLIALLRRWTGPLEDHALRTTPHDPRYRLIRLLGLDNAEALFRSFATALGEAIELAQTDPAAVPAHRLSGLSGMVGFGDLSRLWASVDRGEPGALDAAVSASRAVLQSLG